MIAAGRNIALPLALLSTRQTARWNEAASPRLFQKETVEYAMAKKRKSRTATARRSKTKRSGRRWSARVTRESDALDLRHGVFAKKDPKAIARSLKRSAEHSRRRKANPYRSALSMLTFYINRAGKNLPASRKKVLQRAKDELRHAFGRD
jgi:hypothetical protein